MTEVSMDWDENTLKKLRKILRIPKEARNFGVRVSDGQLYVDYAIDNVSFLVEVL